MALTRTLANRIIHGDCLDELRKLPDDSVDAIITDPPYGIALRPTWRKDKRRCLPAIANDNAPFIWFLLDAYRVLKDGGAMLCFARHDVEQDFRRAATIAGFRPKAQVIWSKLAHGVGDCLGDFAPAHENIIFAVKGRFVLPGRRPRTVLSHRRITGVVHPNEKPVALMEELIEVVTKPGDLVLHPFLGSGTTACAALKTGRRFLGIELEERYVDIAKARLRAMEKAAASR